LGKAEFKLSEQLKGEQCPSSSMANGNLPSQAMISAACLRIQGQIAAKPHRPLFKPLEPLFKPLEPLFVLKIIGVDRSYRSPDRDDYGLRCGSDR